MADADVEIPKHYRTTFATNVELLLSNGGSILRPHVMEMPITGEKATVVDQFGTVRGVEDTDRYGDTPVMTVPRDRRWVFPRKQHWGTVIEEFDKLKTVLDPTSMIVKGAGEGLGENLDYDVILPAFFGDARVGGGGENTESFDSVNSVVAHGGTGMTVAKIQAAHKKFRQAKVKLTMERPKLAMTAQQEDELFNDVKAIHGDYIQGRPLEKGMLPSLFNFDFVYLEDLPKVGNVRRCPAWVPSGLVLGMEKTITSFLERSPGKKYNYVPYLYFVAGATRTQQGKVLEIQCQEP